MTEMIGEKRFVGRRDRRQLLARLAAAVMVADGRITDSEVSAVERLERLGLGPLTTLVEAEIERATHEPIDLAATIDELGEIAPEAAALVVSGLAQVATSDRDLSSHEIDVLTAVAAGLGLSEPEAAQLIGAGAPGAALGMESGTAEAPLASASRLHRLEMPVPPAVPGMPPSSGRSALDIALHTLGLPPGSSAEQADAAYAALVRRYNPTSVLELGPEFAVLAVRKLSAVTAAYSAARAALEAS